jgi:hypothetical protein
MRKRCSCGLALLLILACPGLGQNIVSMSTSGNVGSDSFHGTATFQTRPFLAKPITNAPYSGEESGESVQTLPNGTHITRQNMGQGRKTWRDSQGRVRTEEPRMFGPRNDPSSVPLIAQITDPVAGYSIVLDNLNKVAHRTKLGDAGPRRQGVTGSPAMLTAMPGAGGEGSVGWAVTSSMGSGGVVGGVIGAVGGGGGGGGGGRAGATARPAADFPRPDVTTESLGTKIIDGTSVAGTRRTTVIPTGMQGNDGPITQTSESWFSRELNLTVLTVNIAPDGTTQTQRIANLRLTEPDPSLFMIPPDYAVVDEAGPSFTITWGQQK